MAWAVGYGGAAVQQATTPQWTTLLDVDYSSVAAGGMTGTKLRTLFHDSTMPASYSGYARMPLVSDPQRGQIMRIDFTEGLGNGTSPDEAIQMFINLDFSLYPGGFTVAKNRAIRMIDWMKYPTTYMFPPAQKVCGLGGNIGAASNGAASGGNGLADLSEALSCRVMNYSAIDGNWSSGVPGSSSSLIGRNNRLAMYSYYNNMGSAYGKDLWNPDPGSPGHWPSSRSGSPARAFGDGVWHKRELVMVPNTKVGSVWQSDGKIRFYIDDELIHKYDNIPWRTNDNLWVNKYWLHHFLGGSGAAYASPQTQSYFCDGPIIEAANFNGWTAD